MKVVVMGAGVIGVTTAYYLAKQGAEATREQFSALQHAQARRLLGRQPRVAAASRLSSNTWW